MPFHTLNMPDSRAKFTVAVAIFLIAATSARAQVTCSNASLVGSYGISLDGAAFQATGAGPAFQKSIGLLAADGSGVLQVAMTTSANGIIGPTLFNGSYTIQANCTGSITLNSGGGPPLVLALGVGDGGQSAVLAGVLSSTAFSGTLAKAVTGCSTSGLTGGYNWETAGELVQSGGAFTAASGFINTQFDGKGGLTGGLIGTQFGTAISVSITGNYTINGNCAGTIHFLDTLGLSYNMAFVLVDAGARMLSIQTDANTINGGLAIATGLTTSSGSIAQVASAGGWSTTFTLVNSGATPAQAQLNFFDQNGAPLALPLTFPQTSSSAPLLMTTISRTLNPGATLQIVTTGPDAQPTQTGWAQLIASGNIGGHAVFSQSSGASLQEAVVPIETRNSASFVLPFDNTAGYNTGVAIANLSASTLNLGVIVRDDTGASIQTQTLTLPAQGQVSFNLTDRFSLTAKKLGTIEFDAPTGGQISVLGLRFNPTGAFSTVPPLGE